MRVEAFKNKKDEDKVRRYFKNHRDKRRYPLFIVGMNTGLRIGDIVKLQMKNFQNGYLSLIESKTSKRKIVVVNSEVLEILQEYYSNSSKEDYLFPSQKGGYIGEIQAWRWFKEAKKKCRIKYNIATHTMRKTLGKKVNDKHGIDETQLILGHDNQRDTLRYIGKEQDLLDNIILTIND